MKHTRFIIGAFVAGSIALGIACSFPDVGFTEGIVEAGTGLDTLNPPAPEEAGSDGGDGGDGGVDSSLPTDVDPNGADAAPVTLDDASVVPVDASGCKKCDCDGDGYDRLDLAAGCDGGGVKRGVDCDDSIKAINPGRSQDFITNVWPSTTYLKVGDWDCNGQVSKQYPYGVNCGLLCGGNLGFSDDPQCGGSGNYVRCTGLPPLLCGSTFVDNRVQGCH
jgi:hypothetical protein